MTSKHVIVDGVECKVCPGCHETKPLSEFGRRRSNNDGLCESCKKCTNGRNVESLKRRAIHNHQIHIWIPKSEYRELDKLAKIAKMDTGSMVRAVVLNWLESTRDDRGVLQ